MVVVYPDHVPVLNILDDGLGEEPIHLSVGTPGGFVEGYLARVVVEEWPENRVCGRWAELAEQNRGWGVRRL